MNAPVQARPAWSRRKVWSIILGLLALQAALIWWFGGHGPVARRPASPAPRLRLTGPRVEEPIAPGDSIDQAAAGTALAVELLALRDPTLFAQSHPRSFSGAAWMRIPQPTNAPDAWSEPPRWLAFDAHQLGTDLQRFVQTNHPLTAVFTAKADAALALPKIEETAPATARPSRWRLEGPLAHRRWLNPPTLAGQPHVDLLTNSIVQVLVNSDGNVIAPPVLLGRSGRPEADRDALAFAKTARFEPMPRENKRSGAVSPLTWGTLVFEWQTLPLPATNAPAGNP